MSLQSPVEAHILVSANCAFNCAQCPYFFSSSESVTSRETISRIFTTLANHDVRHALLIAPDCSDMTWLPEVIKVGINQGIDFDMVTGGPMPPSLLWPQLAKAGLSTVMFEIFGASKTHDSVTRPGSFDETLRAITDAKKSGLKVAAVLQMLAGANDDPTDLIEALPVGIDGLILQFFIPFKPHQTTLAIEESEAFTRWERFNEVVPEGMQLRYSSCGRLPKVMGIKLCAAGRFKIAVDHDGTVKPCEHFIPSSESRLGNLLTDTVEELWSAPLLQQIRGLVPGAYSGACGQCDESHLCSACCAPGINLFSDVSAGVPVCRTSLSDS